MTLPSDPRTLQGLRVLLTRSAADNRAWATELERRGASVEALACIASVRLPAGPELAAACEGAAWLVLGSRRAVDAVAEHDVDLPARLACVGPATLAAATARLVQAERPGPAPLVSTDGTMAALAEQLLEQLEGPTQLVLAAADRAGSDLERLLEPAGHTVRRVTVYRTLPAQPARSMGSTGPARPALTGLDAVVLGSPSALEGLTNLRAVPSGLPLVTLGPTTSAAVRTAGLGPVIEAASPDLNGVTAALASLHS
ncbi:MAG: uroporphyrinogen-III synthase [Planctomycetota bacterium]|nr:uroporphyrinogen-III synthase [Planctomycetota bacterium]